MRTRRSRVWVEKHNRYAIWEAANLRPFLSEPIPQTIGRAKRLKRRLKKIVLRLPLRPLVRFVYAYFLRLGFLDGKPGFYFCGLLAFYDFLAEANLYERRVRETRTVPAGSRPAIRFLARTEAMKNGRRPAANAATESSLVAQAPGSGGASPKFQGRSKDVPSIS